MKKVYFKNGIFFNNDKESRLGYLISIIWTFAVSLKKRFFSIKKKLFHPALSLEKVWSSNDIPSAKSMFPLITWIGQSTFLIQIDGINILTDPIFGDLAFLYKRFEKPGIALEDLPTIDYILISHNHRDHMEEKALLYLKKFNPIICVPLGNKKWFDKRGFKNVIEFSWWQDKVFLAVSKNIKFSFLPAHHWSSRDVWDMNRSLWGSWMIEGDKTIYFAGDSAYSDNYKIISDKFSTIDIALMPIGPNEPRKELDHVHMSTEQACMAFLDLKAKNFIPMHWGTFWLASDHFDDPIVRLKTWWRNNEHSVHDKVLHIAKFGQKNKF